MALIGAGKSRSHVWEVRHAGLLGIKYEVAVRSDLVDNAEVEDGKKILRGVVEAAVLGYVASDTIN
jgi:TATA-binding protein-associated factor